jgi:hypothetical protein
MTKTEIKQFEWEQKEFGTKIAIYNLYCKIAGDLLKHVGVKSIKVK